MALNPSARTQRVLDSAQQEAAAFGHDYVGTEHLLLALLRDKSPPAQSVLSPLGVTPRHVESEVDRVIGRGESRAALHDAPFTPAAEGALERGRREAEDAGSDQLEPEHLLIAICAHGDGLAARILRGLDVSAEQLRSAVAQQG